MNINPVEILQTLIRFDTTNPPGNETQVMNWARDLLAEAGIESQILAREPHRGNLIARIKGEGNAPPLLLQGHVDVVTTEGQDWQHPPFGAELIDGYIWGRGALDMKGPVSMMISAFLRAHLERLHLPGDVILFLLADEESAGGYGARYLVEEHPALFEGVRYALGEFGGFSMKIAGQTFYPIMISEKQFCWMKLRIKGPGGHGAFVLRGGAMAKLGKILTKLDKNRLPTHITPAVQEMINSLADSLPFPTGNLLRQLLKPAFTNTILNLLGTQGETFDPLFHNTINATVVRGGDKSNVIPSEIILDLDGRLLPGYTPQDMEAELRSLLGEDFELDILLHEPGPAKPNMGLFPTLADILKQKDPSGNP